ncbi:MAG: DUF349 domain-containing protein [Reichenbachiella sp.]
MEIPFGHIKDGSLFRSAFGEFEELKLKEVVEEELEEMLVSCTEAFKKLESKVDDIQSKINSSDNKGSFLSSLQNLKQQIAAHEGLGDYAVVLEKIVVSENQLSEYIAKNRLKNTDIKTALLLELDEILSNNDHEEAFEQILNLKGRWLKTGSPAEDVKAELNSKYDEGLNSFFEKRKEFEDDKKELIEARVSEYKDVIAKIEVLIKKGNFGHSFDVVKGLQTEWKEIGRVGESAFKSLNDEYWKVCQDYFDKQKNFRKAQKKNKSTSEKEVIAGRKQILGNTTELLGNSLSKVVSKELSELKKVWKEAGSLPKKLFGEFQDEFYQKVRSIEERQFILSLAKRKFKGFEGQTVEEKKRLLIKTVRDLLSRDETELKSFEENMDKMHINKGSFVEMLESKLSVQREKVNAKKQILNELKTEVK